MYSRIIAFILFFLIVTPVSAGVVINEFLPNPSGDDSGEPNEWIELFNSDSNSIDLSGWTLDDEEGGTTPYIIASGSSIPANGFFVLEKSVSGIGLNNSGDSVRLINSANNQIDHYSFSSTSEDISIGRNSDGGGSWTICTSPTKGSSNNCQLPTATLAPTASTTSTNTPTKTMTPTVTIAITKTPTATMKKQTPTPTPEESEEAEEVLGDTVVLSETPVATVAGTRTFQPIIISLLFVGAGLGLLSGVFIWKKRNEIHN